MSWFNKGKEDAFKGKGATNMQNAPSQAREQYEAGYKKQQAQNRDKKG